MSYSIGIDIGGTNIVLGLVEDDRSILSVLRLATRDIMSVEDLIGSIANGIIELIEESKGRVETVGIGAPNGNYYNGSIEHAPNLRFKGVIPIRDMLINELASRGYSLDVVVDNDANIAALGEMSFGMAKGVKDFMMITLGTGVGSGIVVDGELMRGSDGFAGEVGHIIIQPEGRLCGCGRRGCVETYSSITGLKTTAIELLATLRTDSVLRGMPADSIGGFSIHRAAIEGDSIAKKCFDIAGKMLGIGLANAVAITSPELIVLYGGMAKSGDMILKPLRRSFEKSLFTPYRGSIEILISELNEDEASLLGAASLARNRL